MLDAVVDFLPSPARHPRRHRHGHQGHRGARASSRRQGARSRRWPSRSSSDPFGRLTYFRVYSGSVEKGAEVYNSTKERKERLGRILLMHANHREDLEVAMAGDIVAGPRLQEHHDGRHAVRPRPPGDPRAHGVPRARHPRGHRAPHEGRPGQAGQGPLLPVGGGPHLPRPHRRRDGPDRDLRHGRAAPRGAGRPDAARVQRGRHRRQAAGRLPRDDHQGRPPRRVPPRQADRWRRPVRPRGRSTSSPPGPVVATSSWTRSAAARSRGSTSPRSTRASSKRSMPACSPGTPPSTCGPPSWTARTTTSTPPRWRSRSPARWSSRTPPASAAPVLLEPIMGVEVVTPEDYMGDVIGDLSSRRGRIEGMEARGNSQVDPGAGPACRRCSGTVPTSVRGPRAAPRTPCSSTRTSRYPTTIADEIVKRVRGE